jgi:16S rRNA (guanine527-N7)-methyltransferase
VKSDFKEVLVLSLKQAGISIQGLPLDRFDAFYQILKKWQASLNLTAISDPESIADRHFCESIFLLGRIEKKDGKLLDFGSGNGFPALPLKIAIPELDVTLVESRKKKCHFLKAAVRELGLHKVVVLDGRFERLSAIAEERRFDYFTMRGVGNIIQLLDGLPLIMKHSGKAFIYAGERTLPLLDVAAMRIGARRKDILLPGRNASFITILENF